MVQVAGRLTEIISSVKKEELKKLGQELIRIKDEVNQKLPEIKLILAVAGSINLKINKDGYEYHMTLSSDGDYLYFSYLPESSNNTVYGKFSFQEIVKYGVDIRAFYDALLIALKGSFND